MTTGNDDLAAFVAAVGRGETPSRVELEAAAGAINAMLSMREYHERAAVGVAVDLAEADSRNIDAAKRLAQRVLVALQRPVAGSQHHAVLVGGHELTWLANFLHRAVTTEKGTIRLVPGGGHLRHDRQRKLEDYAHLARDNLELPEGEAMQLTEWLRRSSPDLIYKTAPIVKDGPDKSGNAETNRDRFRKELLPKARAAEAVRQRARKSRN